MVNLADRRRSSLSRSERPPFSSKSITLFDDDIQKQNSLSPEFGTKFEREVSLFLEISKFPFNTVQDC